MNLLFIQGGSRWKYDTEGNVYTDSNFNSNVWERYLKLCDKLTVVLRREEKMYSASEAKQKFNKFDTKKADYIALPDLYRPVKNILNFAIRKEIERVIARQVQAADKVIIRSLGNIYTNTTFKYCKKYGKSYLVEVTGFEWEGLWYHSLRGKLVAFYKEKQYKKMMKDVLYAVYVTQNALQNRYPSKGKTLGCSDVEIDLLDEGILLKRLQKILNRGSIIIVGTAAFLDVKWKGQESVIRALAELKRHGITNIKYQLVGAGNPERLKNLAKNLGVENQVHVIGALSHDKVFRWLEKIDIYIQPSFQEGLCRSVIEAMSRACPIIASDVGGNYELIEKSFLFKKGNYKEMARLIHKMTDSAVMRQQAECNFKKAKKYQKNILNAKREKFYIDFMNSL